jgi:5'-phosphate synthase pdxT subunit
MSRIGVLALQGDFTEHIQAFERLGVDVVEIRLPRQMEDVKGIVIPGGESTTIIKLMDIYGFTEVIKKEAQDGLPVWGTCAGMIVAARHILEDEKMGLPLGLIDLDVRRNAFGRQVDSFEVDLPVPALGGEPFHAVFIRAPVIERVGAEAETLAKLPDGAPVAACQDNVIVTSFHPELTQDTRFHEYFLKMAGLGSISENSS